MKANLNAIVKQCNKKHVLFDDLAHKLGRADGKDLLLDLVQDNYGCDDIVEMQKILEFDYPSDVFFFKR